MAAKAFPDGTPTIVKFEAQLRQEGDCLIWIGSTKGGYSQLYDGSVSVYAHRWAYEYFVGPIPEGLQIDHVRDRGCISPLCCNIDHLEVVTLQENLKRARLKVCRSGRHDLTVPENVIWRKNGYRGGCAVCSKEAALKWWKERGEEQRRLRRQRRKEMISV